ncbi:hypothetical protein ACFXPR_18110 [Nocardia tengchongensis]|uniref:hypothetical protein n=1 Tax=Nocardia tengchongensis TaxID=2055889 RepID=UPI0036868FF7
MGEDDAINDDDAAKARAAGWHEPTGTDPQLGWATTVRQDKLGEFDGSPITEPQRGRMRAVLRRETRAEVWIGNRWNPWAAVWLVNLTDEERDSLFPTFGSSDERDG